MASSSTRELTTRSFSDFYDPCEVDYKEGCKVETDLAFVEKIFAAAKNAPKPTGKALELQTRKIAVIEKNQPDAMSYALIGGIAAVLGAATAGVGPAVVGALGGPSVYKLINDSNLSDQTDFIKAYIKAYPATSETELDTALQRYLNVQELNINRGD